MRLIIYSLFFSFAYADSDSELKDTLRKARIVPHIENGNVVGYRAVEIQSDSLWQKLGFKKGEVIRSINGQRIVEPSKTLKVLSELKDNEKLKLEEED